MRRDDAAALPEVLTAGGVQREITIHLRQRAAIRGEITPQHLVDVLENWVIRGVIYDEDGRPSMAHLGWVEYRGVERLMPVAVSMDDRRIATAFLDTPATIGLNSGDVGYFQSHYERLEVRGGAETTLRPGL